MRLYQAEVYNRGTWGMCYFYADSCLEAVTAIYNQCKVGNCYMQAWRVKPCIYMPF